MTVTLTSYLRGIITALFNPSALQDDGDQKPSGPNGVRKAMEELGQLGEKTFEAKLGLPDIVEDDEAKFFGDPKVVIPIEDAPYGGVNRLVFDLPQGMNDETAEINRMMNAVGVDSLEELKGKTVPVGFFGGNAAVLWDKLLEDEKPNPSKGGETASNDTGKNQSNDSKTDEATAQSSSDGEQSSSDQKTADDSSSGEGSNSNGVKVEEKTVSPTDSGTSSDDGTE